MILINRLLVIPLVFISSFLCSQGYSIQNYDVDIQLQADGSFNVVETIDVFFTEKRRGIFRHITTQKDLGKYIQEIRLTDFDTGDMKHKLTEKKGKAEIRLGSSDVYITGPKQYTISYRVTNGIIPHDMHDEFYWSLMGSSWDVDIENVSFDIKLPSNVALNADDVAVYTDKNSPMQHADVKITDGRIFGKSLTKVKNGESMSVAFKTPKGYYPQLDYSTILTEKSRQTSSKTTKAISDKVYPRDVGFPIPAFLIAALLFFFNRKGKNKLVESGDRIYYPPEDLNPPEIGVFHDFEVNKSDVISLIPYWGKQGYLKVASLPKDDGTIDMRFEKQKDLPDDTPSYEKQFFDAIFKTGDSVYLHDLENEMYSSFSTVGKSLKSEVLDMKLYDQEAKRTFHSGRFIMFGIVSILIAVTVGVMYHAMASAILLGIFGLVCFNIHLKKPKMNDRGIRLHDHLISLKRTLKNPDSEELNRIVKSDPNYLDTIFPYVVAFGLDKSWSDNVSPIFNKAPDWYYGDGMTMRPDFHTFNQGFSPSRIGKTMTSYPVADSSSSAFGGGSGGFSGSSGGGFGGGGGGGSW